MRSGKKLFHKINFVLSICISMIITIFIYYDKLFKLIRLNEYGTLGILTFILLYCMSFIVIFIIVYFMILIVYKIIKLF